MSLACQCNLVIWCGLDLLRRLAKNLQWEAVADFGGDASPPTNLKLTIWAEKSVSISKNQCPFWGASPPTSLNLTISPEKSVSISVETFLFFFLFGDHLILSGKKRLNFRKISVNFGGDLFFFFWRPPDFGRKKHSNFRFRPKNQSPFQWRYPNFWSFMLKILKIPPIKIFWIRHWWEGGGFGGWKQHQTMLT